jgi:hypothetical protein
VASKKGVPPAPPRNDPSASFEPALTVSDRSQPRLDAQASTVGSPLFRPSLPLVSAARPPPSSFSPFLLTAPGALSARARWLTS